MKIDLRRTEQPVALASGIDGRTRTYEDEFKLNEAMYETFSQPAGKRVYDYLQSLTINAVTDSTASMAQLRHLEGQRYLFMIINRRMTAGANKEPHYDRPDITRTAGGRIDRVAGATNRAAGRIDD